MPGVCAGSVGKDDDLHRCATMVGLAPEVLLNGDEERLDGRQQLRHVAGFRGLLRHSLDPASCLLHIRAANPRILMVFRHYIFPGDAVTVLHAGASDHRGSLYVLAIFAPDRIHYVHYAVVAG